jgi:hypothetical protein
MAAPVILAVDPGRGKCGVAVCSAAGVLAKAVVSPADLPALVRRWIDAHGVSAVVVGELTGSDAAVRALEPVVGTAAISRVDEAGTTLLARARYFRDHPPRGWRRLLPVGLQTPPEPYDDYVAVLLAERALADRSPVA